LRGACALIFSLAVCDLVLGSALSAMADRVRTGEKLGVFNLVALREDARVLVLGSSRAFCHFDPAELAPDALNAGINGQGIAMARILFRLSPAKPDYVLIEPMFFEDEEARLSSAHHLYGRDPLIDEILSRSSFGESLKLRSRLYRTAGVAAPALVHGWSIRQEAAPRFNGLPPRPGPLEPRRSTRALPDERWWNDLSLLIGEVRAGGSEPVIVISPCAEPSLAPFFDAVRNRLGTGVRVIDSRDFFPPTSEHFVDTMHLNSAAAKSYSRMLSSQLAPNKK
jgi:hypothetical protein